MKQADLVPITHVDVSYKWKPPKGDFKVEVQPIIAKTVALCGYEINFFKTREPETGKWIYPIYTLDSRKFPPRVKSEGLKSVLPEIMVKLTNPIGPVVNIINTEVIRAEPKTKGKRNA
jgi:hypothetical protein